ncbi:hypothetical protein BGZ61DRAFT_128991 [Ilyonectria robusta]|uniref:uncharacterized protein n=1 Tax=Ilyonectria robusta TaxID=1079257 RepID=UPI001E8EEDAC|nr:uncharacterized protein BGZ61DRAFT_128991 [Ilyonectria robusta]KAH8734741.1 hypothetical protein BGZ61DRAFT_128991 [Ilyonectria robusta]
MLCAPCSANLWKEIKSSIASHNPNCAATFSSRPRSRPPGLSLLLRAPCMFFSICWLLLLLLPFHSQYHDTMSNTPPLTLPLLPLPTIQSLASPPLQKTLTGCKFSCDAVQILPPTACVPGFHRCLHLQRGVRAEACISCSRVVPAYPLASCPGCPVQNFAPTVSIDDDDAMDDPGTDSVHYPV